MTTNSEQTGTDPNQQTVVDQAVAAGAQAQQQQTEPPKEPEVVDIDAKEVADALAAAEAEKAAGGGEAGTTAQPGGQQGQQQEQNQPQGGQQQPTTEAVMIPKQRFDEVNDRRTKAEQEAAYWKGVADARATGTQQTTQQGGQQTQQQQQQPTPDQRLAAIHTQQDDLAQKFDNGEITYSDMVKQQRALQNQEQSIREEVLLAKVQPANQQQPQDNALYLDTLTAELETQHPWVGVFDQVGTAVDWKYLKDRASENLIARGVDPNAGDIGKYNLRKEVAELADQLGPGMIADKAKAKGIAIPGQQAPQQQGGQQQMSPTAQARAAKLNLQENAPPSLQRMSGTTGDGTPTDARLEAMSDDELGNLPDSTRRRLLGLAQA